MVEFHQHSARKQPNQSKEAFRAWPAPDGTLWTQFFHLQSGTLVRFPGLADFEISPSGREVQCWPAEGISEASIHHLYLNQVMPLARSRVGQLVFHAGAVVLRRGCVAFLGQSGRGKSTLVASFATSGYSFLTDDGLLVECVGGTHRVLPSHPSIRLWRDSEEALLDRSAVPQPAVQYTSKSRFVAGGKIDFNDEPQVLRAVYLLGDGTAPQPTIEPLSESEALMALVRNSFLLDIDQRSALASHFDELARMARVPMFYRLDYPRRFEELPLVIAAITSHAREYTTGPDMPAAEG